MAKDIVKEEETSVEDGEQGVAKQSGESPPEEATEGATTDNLKEADISICSGLDKLCLTMVEKKTPVVDMDKNVPQATLGIEEAEKEEKDAAGIVVNKEVEVVNEPPDMQEKQVTTDAEESEMKVKEDPEIKDIKPAVIVKEANGEPEDQQKVADISICSALASVSLAPEGSLEVKEPEVEVKTENNSEKEVPEERGESRKDSQICSDMDKITLLETLEKQQEQVERGHREETAESTEQDDEENEDGTPKPTQRGDLPVETLICEHRAKLYRFDSATKSWKERGIGNIILVQSLEDPKACRVVMWVDGNGRIACNFRLYPELTTSLHQGNPKVACWRALDMSDQEEPTWESFCCRFASAEQCSSFTTKLVQYATEPPTFVSVETIEESVPELEPNQEEEAETSNCAGCIGCNPDEYQFPEHVHGAGPVDAIIDIKLGPESCAEFPVSVKPSDFLLN